MKVTIEAIKPFHCFSGLIQKTCVEISYLYPTKSTDAASIMQSSGNQASVVTHKEQLPTEARLSHPKFLVVFARKKIIGIFNFKRCSTCK